MLRLFSAKLLGPTPKTLSYGLSSTFAAFARGPGQKQRSNNSEQGSTENRTLFSKKGRKKQETQTFTPASSRPPSNNRSAPSPDEPMKARNEDEDVHSRRFANLSKMQNDESFLSLRNEFYKFTFDYSTRSVDVNLNDINIVNIENEETFHRIPKLAHHLDVVVKKPGVYPIESLLPLQSDGGAFLKKIYQPDEIDFSQVPSYTPPSQDKLLLKFAQESKIRYVMSTSTISNVLSQMFYLFSCFRNPSFHNISESYLNEPKKFMISQRKPITNILRKIDPVNGIYALDSDPGLFTFKNSILMDLGKIIERSLTLPAETFKRALLKDGPRDAIHELEEDHHRFMKLNNEICLRSQIDCHDIDPATGKPFVFEIKTRSVCPIRYDLYHYEDYLDYNINSYRGLHSSFEREYYDLIRGGFLKYCFQLKIGRMDGAFIAYHNTQETFGFEYVKTKEIERRIFGNDIYADATFVCCSKLLVLLLNNILEAVKDEKHEMLKIGFYSDSSMKRMIVFAELFEDISAWDQRGLLDPSDEIKDEYDYFTKYAPLRNKVLKFEFHIYIYINGILQNGPEHQLSRGDQIEIKYKFKPLGTPTFIDYMNFLHEAYKFEAVNIDLAYMGAWVK